jgi:hypothetical protein
MPLLCLGEATKITSATKQALYPASRFKDIRTVSDLPQSIIVLCADRNGRLAGPGEKWEPTDVVTDGALPTKRLIWAATDGDYYVVHYERGGRGHSYHVLVAKLENVHGLVLWRGVGGPFNDYPAFLKALQDGAHDDRLDYAY